MIVGCLFGRLLVVCLGDCWVFVLVLCFVGFWVCLFCWLIYCLLFVLVFVVWVVDLSCGGFVGLVG